MLITSDTQNKSIIFGEANSLESHDVLHTTLAMAAVCKNMPSEAKTINQSRIFESLMGKALFRIQKFNHYFSKSGDLTTFKGHYPFFILAPLCMEFLLGEIETPESLIELYLNQIESLIKDMIAY